jgi:hypothetical protein
MERRHEPLGCPACGWTFSEAPTPGSLVDADLAPPERKRASYQRWSLLHDRERACDGATETGGPGADVADEPRFFRALPLRAAAALAVGKTRAGRRAALLQAALAGDVWRIAAVVDAGADVDFQNECGTHPFARRGSGEARSVARRVVRGEDGLPLRSVRSFAAQ